MGRKNKNVVDYFPHDCSKESKTIYVLERRFGNDGYAVWFKTLELLGASENHFYDCRNPDDWEFLCAKMNVDEEKLTEIYDLLAKKDAINAYLWGKKVIWSSNFIKNLEDLYNRRVNKCMHFDDLCTHIDQLNGIYVNINGINDNICTQSKGKESKVLVNPENPISATETKPPEKPPKKTPEEIAEDFKKRKNDFIEKIKHLSKVNGGKYDTELVTTFFNYWTEPNKSGTKMRFEAETFFDVNKRIATFQKLENKNKQKNHEDERKKNTIDFFREAIG